MYRIYTSFWQLMNTCADMAKLRTSKANMVAGTRLSHFWVLSVSNENAVLLSPQHSGLIFSDFYIATVCDVNNKHQKHLLT